jgi:hypothetical protein
MSSECHFRGGMRRVHSRGLVYPCQVHKRPGTLECLWYPSWVGFSSHVSTVVNPSLHLGRGGQSSPLRHRNGDDISEFGIPDGRPRWQSHCRHDESEKGKWRFVSSFPRLHYHDFLLAAWWRLVGVMKLLRRRRAGCSGGGPIGFIPWLSFSTYLLNRESAQSAGF